VSTTKGGRWSLHDEPAVIASISVVSSGGALALGLVVGVWWAATAAITAALATAAGMEATLRARDRRQADADTARQWDRIVWEEFGYRGDHR